MTDPSHNPRKLMGLDYFMEKFNVILRTLAVIAALTASTCCSKDSDEHKRNMANIKKFAWGAHLIPHPHPPNPPSPPPVA
jgi:hypothetical protein